MTNAVEAKALTDSLDGDTKNKSPMFRRSLRSHIIENNVLSFSCLVFDTCAGYECTKILHKARKHSTSSTRKEGTHGFLHRGFSYQGGRPGGLGVIRLDRWNGNTLGVSLVVKYRCSHVYELTWQLGATPPPDVFRLRLTLIRLCLPTWYNTHWYTYH